MTATPYSASTAPFDSQLPVPSRPSRSAWPWWLMMIMSGGTAIYAAKLFHGPPNRAFRRALSYPPRTHHGRKRRAASRSLAILDETSRARAEPASLARTHLSGRGRARVTRWIHAGILFRGGSTDTLRLWRSCRTACRAHAVLACLSDCVMALLGSEPARRRMASASPSEPGEPLLARKGFLDPKLKAIFRRHVCS
jgi:hypothetical protein